MIYLIRHKLTGKYSKGGSPCPAWTDNLADAKVWKRKSFIKSHLTNIKKYRERWGKPYSHPQDANDPEAWIVIEAEIQPRNTYEASTFS